MIDIQIVGDSITSGAGGGLTPDQQTGFRKSLSLRLRGEIYPTRFVGTQVSGEPGDWDHHHEGHAGFRLDELDNSITFWLGAHKPHIILLLAGLNDIGSLQADSAPARFGNLLDDMHISVPGALILVSPLTPRPPDWTMEKVNLLNTQFPAVIELRRQAGRRVVWCPGVGGALQWTADPSTTDMDPDGSHPNARGYEKLALGWHGALSRWLPVVTGS